MNLRLVNYLLVVLLILTLVLIVSKLFLFKKEKFSISLTNEEKNESENQDIDNRCTPENNCFRGSYLRSQIYTNVCQIEGENNMMNKLTRLPKLTKDRCYRTLANDDKFKCSVNKHGQRNCFWEK
jgi:hypothetical protein